MSNYIDNLLASAKDEIDKVNAKAKAGVSQIFKDNNWSGGYYDLCRVIDTFQVDLIKAIDLDRIIHCTYNKEL